MAVRTSYFGNCFFHDWIDLGTECRRKNRSGFGDCRAFPSHRRSFFDVGLAGTNQLDSDDWYFFDRHWRESGIVFREMKFQRRLSSLRLRDFDYSEEGAYFVTICTKDKKCFFGEVKNKNVVLNEAGKIVQEEWNHTVIMPNHIHGIVYMHKPVGAHCNAPLPKNNLSWIIRGFKSATTTNIRKFLPHFAWQRSFYDRIIRNEKELECIHEYILLNPEKWELEKDFPENLKL